MNQKLLLPYTIFISLINIVNAQEDFNPDSILTQEQPLPEEYKETQNEAGFIQKVKKFITSDNGLIIAISAGAVILLIILTSIIYTIKKVRKEKEENPYIEASKQDFYNSSNGSMAMKYEGIPKKEVRSSDNTHRFNIGIPTAQDEEVPFPSNAPKIHAKNPTPMPNIRINDDLRFVSNNNTMNSNYSSNNRNNNTMNSNYSSSNRNNNTMNSNYSSNNRNNNTMNSNYSSNNRNNNTMNSNYSSNNNTMNLNYSPNNRINNTMNSNFNSNEFNNNTNNNNNNVAFFDTEDDEGNDYNASPFEKLIKNKPQPMNVFDRESNPNRTSSLIGEDDINRLNGLINNENSTDSFIQNYYGDGNNGKQNDSDIPPEFRNLKDYSVVHNFVPHRFDELEVEKGNMLKMVKSFEDGWALCFNTNTKKKGFIPKNKLRLIEDESKWNNNQAEGIEKNTMNNENVNGITNQPNNPLELNQNINDNKDIMNNNNNNNSNNNISSNNNKADHPIEKDKINNQAISTNTNNDDGIKVIPEFDKGKLILQKTDIENNKSFNQVVIEDNMVSYDSCHVIIDYTDTSTSFNTSNLNNSTLQSPNGSNEESSIGRNVLVDSLLKPRNFVPTKSKLQSMEFGSEMDDDDNDDDNNEDNEENVDESVDEYPNDNSLSDASVQQLSLGRQLLSYQTTTEQVGKHQRKRSASQPLLPSDDIVSPLPMNKTRPRSKSQGRMSFYDENRRRSNRLSGFNRDSQLSIDTNFNRNMVEGRGRDVNPRFNDNRDNFNAISPKNNYNYMSEPRRKNTDFDEISPKPNYDTEPRGRDEREFNRDPRFERNERDYNPRMMRSPQPGEYRNRSKSRSPSRAGEYRGDLRSPSNASSYRGEPRTPTGNRSFRSEPRTPTANNSFRGEPRSPRTPTANNSFRGGEPRTPRTPTANNNFRGGEPRSPRTPTSNNSFRGGEPRTPTSNNSFRGGEREPRLPTQSSSFRGGEREPRLPTQSSSFRGGEREPRLPTQSSSFRGGEREPRLPTQSSSFRGGEREPRLPTQSSSFRGGEREPRLPTQSSSFRGGEREPRLPTQSSSFRGGEREPRLPTQSSSFRGGEREPRLPTQSSSFRGGERDPMLPTQSSSFRNEKIKPVNEYYDEPRNHINYRNEQKPQFYNQF
ncbi:hypothetical protein BCR36DRAFT_584345 [Piromyces finnis]|uniref:SH3 domain-containing protein n=1 Tax=Piromyces finnis TaxID=1754191 RepID=A0A1Y1V6S6_9FUNG|nr:hypothetical protein BCR36DRAFT_584345 [Piromyces finnis]|eukprot:ORX48433.1 hypothetical protein BCR36DRAFT_584345 [Piromyces finnis]